MKWTAKLYDGAGNEIELKPGHVMVMGKESFCQVPIDDYAAKMVFRDPATGKEYPMECEFGSTAPIDFIRSGDEEVYDGDAGDAE